MKNTHTYAVLEVSHSTHADVEMRLRAVVGDDRFVDEFLDDVGLIVLGTTALRRDPRETSLFFKRPEFHRAILEKATVIDTEVTTVNANEDARATRQSQQRAADESEEIFEAPEHVTFANVLDEPWGFGDGSSVDDVVDAVSYLQGAAQALRLGAEDLCDLAKATSVTCACGYGTLVMVDQTECAVCLSRRTP